MILKAPFEIGSRLIPSIRVGDGILSLECVGCSGNRLVWRWYVDIPAGEFSAADLSSGCQDTDNAAGTTRAFGSFLAFLSAAAESYAYNLRRWKAQYDDETDNASLFPAPVVEWALAHVDEIDSLRFELEESGESFLADDE